MRTLTNRHSESTGHRGSLQSCSLLESRLGEGEVRASQGQLHTPWENSGLSLQDNSGADQLGARWPCPSTTISSHHNPWTI